MPRTEAQKRADAAYARKRAAEKRDAKFTCITTPERGEAFRAACEKSGTTPNAVFNAAITEMIDSSAKE